MKCEEVGALNEIYDFAESVFEKEPCICTYTKEIMICMGINLKDSPRRLMLSENSYRESISKLGKENPYETLKAKSENGKTII